MNINKILQQIFTSALWSEKTRFILTLCLIFLFIVLFGLFMHYFGPQDCPAPTFDALSCFSQ